MSKAGLKVTAIVAVLTLLSLAYFVLTFETPQGTTTLVIPPPAVHFARWRDATGVL